MLTFAAQRSAVRHYDAAQLTCHLVHIVFGSIDAINTTAIDIMTISAWCAYPDPSSEISCKALYTKL